jgi:hypothetical protein
LSTLNTRAGHWTIPCLFGRRAFTLKGLRTQHNSRIASERPRLPGGWELLSPSESESCRRWRGEPLDRPRRPLPVRAAGNRSWKNVVHPHHDRRDHLQSSHAGLGRRRVTWTAMAQPMPSDARPGTASGSRRFQHVAGYARGALGALTDGAIASSVAVREPLPLPTIPRKQRPGIHPAGKKCPNA